MSFGKKNLPQKEMYEELQDTPYISNLRDLSQRGYEGYRDNYNRVNAFSPETQASLNARVNDVYRRAEGDFDRQYRDTMQKYANANYGQFGTLNATPALYRTDMENLQQQRKLADLSYNKALYYDDVVNNELNRRYKALDMFNQMLEKGQTPYQLDLANWQLRNTNKDRRFQNQEIIANAGGGALGALKGALSGAATGFMAGGPWGALAGAAAGGLTGSVPQYNTQGQGAFSMDTIANLMSTAYGGLGKDPYSLQQLSNYDTPWASSFEENVLPSYGLGNITGIDYGRRDFLTSGDGQLDWLNGGGFTF